MKIENSKTYTKYPVLTTIMATLQNPTKSIILLTTSVIFLIIGVLCIISTNQTIYYQIGIFTGIVTLTISITTFIMAYKIRQKIISQNSQNSFKYQSSQHSPNAIEATINSSQILTSLNTAVFADATSRGSKVYTTEPLPHELLSHKSLSKVMALHQETMETGQVPIKKLKTVKISPMSSVSSMDSYDMNPVFYDASQKKRINREHFSKAITRYPKTKFVIEGLDEDV